MTLPRKGGVVWCPNCDWTGTKADTETVTDEDRIGRTVRRLACPECGLALDTSSPDTP